MGVWIETKLVFKTSLILIVTPYVGVWIETFTEITNFCIIIVTPYVGVWIETSILNLLVV